jgi:hypothetical protein
MDPLLVVFIVLVPVAIAAGAWLGLGAGDDDNFEDIDGGELPKRPAACPSCAKGLSQHVLRCPSCDYDIYKRSWKATAAPWLVPAVGIVLAHMARSDFKLNPYWRGQTAAVIALVLGYALLAIPIILIAGHYFAEWMSGSYS